MAALWKKMTPAPLALTSLNHISRNCASIEDSVHFYSNILGFVEIKRPGSFHFDGAWLFNYGIGIHLLKDNTLEPGQGDKVDINPMADHISFQCDDIGVVEIGLREHGIKFMRQVVEEGGILVDQLFFHDPDGHMIEICNCQLLPVIPLSTSSCPACITSRSPSLSCLTPKGPLASSPGACEMKGLQKRASSGSLGPLARSGGAGGGPKAGSLQTASTALGCTGQGGAGEVGGYVPEPTSEVQNWKRFEPLGRNITQSSEVQQQQQQQVKPNLSEMLQQTQDNKRRRDDIAPCA